MDASEIVVRGLRLEHQSAIGQLKDAMHGAKDGAHFDVPSRLREAAVRAAAHITTAIEYLDAVSEQIEVAESARVAAFNESNNA